LVKDASQSNYSQYWGYTNPKAFMTPWAGNLISNSLIKKITNVAKPHKNHMDFHK
jgi:hypothetical protein